MRVSFDGVECPECGHAAMVTDSRPRNGARHRRRRCDNCGLRFSTLETVMALSPGEAQRANAQRQKLVNALRFIVGYAEEAADALEALNIASAGNSGQASGRRQSPRPGNGSGS